MHETTKPTAVALSDRVRSLRLPDAAEATGSAWWWLPWAMCGVLLCITALCALEAFAPIDDEMITRLAEERGLNVKKPGAASPAITLPGMPVSTETNEIALESKGYIVPISLIQVSPIISGTVMKLNIEEGKFVEKGYILAQLDITEYKADYDKTEAAVKSAQGRLEELRLYRQQEIQQAKADLEDAAAQRDQALTKYTRSKRLFATNALPPEDLETAQTAYLSYEARVKRAQLAYELLMKGPRDEKIATAVADVAQAQADYDKAKWRYDKTTVAAPITGVILSKKTEEGNIVNPSAFSNGLSASLCEMANLHEMEVDLSIAERDIAKVFKYQECRIRAEAFANRIYPGKVSRIMPMGDRSKGAVPVRVLIDFNAVDEKGRALPKDAQGEYLRPEMGAIVTFINRKAR